MVMHYRISAVMLLATLVFANCLWVMDYGDRTYMSNHLSILEQIRTGLVSTLRLVCGIRPELGYTGALHGCFRVGLYMSGPRARCGLNYKAELDLPR
jgi:hypothetical protein